MEGLHGAVKAGKARYIGISNCFAWQFAKANFYARAHGLTEFVSIQGHYNLIAREEASETIVSMCFHEDGSRLLITTQYECYECGLGSGKVDTVMRADANERLAAGNYRGNEIEVAIVEHSARVEPSVKPHCVYYRRCADGAYLRSWYYLMPKLDENLFRDFLYSTGDLGFGGSNNKDGFQQYWVTKGFFLEQLPELTRLFKPKCYTWHGSRRLKLEKEFQPLDEIFVWHKAAITNRYNVGDSEFSHMYLADDMSAKLPIGQPTAVALLNHHRPILRSILIPYLLTHLPFPATPLDFSKKRTVSFFEFWDIISYPRTRC